MTNKELYGDKLLAALMKSSSCQLMHYHVFGKNCAGKSCVDCEFNSVEDIENWLNAEHEEPEPPLLENGDDLKPGDWIMVRNDEKAHWAKRVFAYYYNDHFYAAVVPQDLVDHAVYKWKQARLPMEGE